MRIVLRLCDILEVRHKLFDLSAAFQDILQASHLRIAYNEAKSYHHKDNIHLYHAKIWLLHAYYQLSTFPKPLFLALSPFIFKCCDRAVWSLYNLWTARRKEPTRRTRWSNQYCCNNKEKSISWDGCLSQEEDPAGSTHSISIISKEAHDELYKFITEEKDKLGGDDSVLLLPGLLTLAEIHIIECRICLISARTKKAEEYLNAAHWSFLKSNDKALVEKKK